MKLEVSVAEQRMRVLGNDGICRRTYVISTSRFGLGSEPGSNFTPLGKFRIVQKIGHGAPLRTIFRSRRISGVWDGGEAPEDYVLTRILWLDGQEEGNANSFSRYIYIHGTNQEGLLGTPASHGCIRMANEEVVELFNEVELGTEVEIGDVPAEALREFV
ncbi:MAG: L,D-transpeptidase [Verrucomicrobiota bacterium]